MAHKLIDFGLSAIIPQWFKSIFFFLKFGSFVSHKSDTIFVQNISIGSGSIVKKASFYAQSPGHLSIGNDCMIEDYVQINCKGGEIILGNNVSINSSSYLSGPRKIIIGNDTMIGPGVKIVVNHEIQSKRKKLRLGSIDRSVVEIQEDCWIGADVVIVSGVRVGRGAVIGANSFVNRDIPPHSVAVGSPVRIIRMRDD